MLTFEEVQTLGNVLDTTWGRSSTTQAPTMSVKCVLTGEEALKITYTTVVTFASDHALSQQVPALENDAVQATNQYLGSVKKEFKAKAGRSLKSKLVSASPSIDLVSLQPHVSPKRTAYFRYVSLLKVT